MSASDELLAESAEELFEDAPCGYLSTDLDGLILKVNRTFETWTGWSRRQLVGGRRFRDLLTPGGRIYYETHYAPLLQMQGWVREIAVDITRADGSRLPALVNAVVRRDDAGVPRVVRTTIFDATDRRRYERELLHARDHDREVANALQQSLLAGALPRDPAFEIAVVYQPSVEGLDVGGDWYDAFWVGARSIGLVIGDVVGRGIDAAATMGQLRSAVRALASTGLGPAALLEALDRYADQHRVGQMATVAYAQLDLDTRTMRAASAGHMPPVLAEAGRLPRFVMDGRSAPLDAYLVPTSRPETEIVIDGEALLVLFTDGLIERVDRPLQQGLDGLLSAVAAGRGLPIEELPRELARTMPADRHAKDDVCVLACRLADV